MDGEGRRKQSLHTQNGTVLETDMALALGAAGKCSVAAKGGGGLEQHPHLCPDPHGLARDPVLPGAPLPGSLAIVVIVQSLGRV